MSNSTELVWLSKASEAIAKVSTVGEAKKYADHAAALRVLAAKQGWSQEQKSFIAEIEIRSFAKMGELLKDTDKQAGSRGVGKKVECPTGIPLSDLGINAKQSHRAQLVASVPAKDREKYIAENKPKPDKLSVTGLVRIAKSMKREERREEDREVVASAPEPEALDGVFTTIVIDPPWDFGDEGDVDQFGRGRPDYATMTIDEIAALPVGEKAAKDS